MSTSLLETVFVLVEKENGAWSNDDFAFGNGDSIVYFICKTFSTFVAGSLTIPLSLNLLLGNIIHEIKS